jgi:putative DNA primase/helicase
VNPEATATGSAYTTVADLDAEIRELQNAAIAADPSLIHQLDPSVLRVFNVAELLKMEFPPREFILEPILQKQGTAELYSGRGVGKTYISLGMACAVASGGPFLRWTAPKPRKILYIDGEMPAITMKQRLAWLIDGMKTDMDPAYFHFISHEFQPNGIPSLTGTMGQKMIEDRIGDAELIFLDNLSTLCRGGKENETESWAPVQDWILSLRRRGLSVLFNHHAGKNGTQRGASSREDILDTVISLKHPKDYQVSEGLRCEIHFEKTRNMYGDDCLSFETQMWIRDGAAHWVVKTDILERQVNELLAEGKSLREVAKELGIDKNKVDRIKQGGIKK